MTVKFPQIDQIMHASLEKDAYSQKEYVKLMNQCNNFINLTFQDLLDRISREYNCKSIVDILGMVNRVLDEEKDTCEHQIVFDDFVRNASLVSQALKKIIYSPSTKLVKIDKNMPANKVTRFDSKTMSWLSRRPGVTIEEKIAPKNIIPTKVTYFTPDTVENRHTMYLFDILYDYLYEKIYPDALENKCENCPHTDKKCYQLYDKLKSILFLKHKIRATYLRFVPKQKQLRQNNKLLADKEYKQIWDAVREVDYYEQNCKDIWENLKERYEFISFLFVCAKIASLDGVRIFDNYSQFRDVNGKIEIKNNEEINTIKFYDSNTKSEIIISLDGEYIHAIKYEYLSNNGIKFVKSAVSDEKINISDIFDEFDNIKLKEDEYKKLVSEIDTLNKQRNTQIDKKKAFIEKKVQIQKLVDVMYLIVEVMNNNGKGNE